MLPNEDPDHFFSRMYKFRDQLNKLGEVTSDARLLSLALKRSNPEYQIIRDLDLKSNDLTLESCQEAMRRLWQQRGEKPPSPNASMSTRGQGMITSMNVPTCGHCGKKGHTKRNCWKLQGRNNNQHTKRGDEEKKWCSYHNSSTHSDAECYHQKKQTALTSTRHQPQSSQLLEEMLPPRLTDLKVLPPEGPRNNSRQASSTVNLQT